LSPRHQPKSKQQKLNFSSSFELLNQFFSPEKALYLRQFYANFVVKLSCQFILIRKFWRGEGDSYQHLQDVCLSRFSNWFPPKTLLQNTQKKLYHCLWQCCLRHAHPTITAHHFWLDKKGKENFFNFEMCHRGIDRNIFRHQLVYFSPPSAFQITELKIWETREALNGNEFILKLHMKFHWSVNIFTKLIHWPLTLQRQTHSEIRLIYMQIYCC
jgi:hypothetical protein